MTFRRYELNPDEYTRVMDSIRYAKENAVTSEEQIRLENLQMELVNQFERQEAKPSTDAELRTGFREE